MDDAAPGRVDWTVDDRPPSLYARLYVWAMWRARDKEAFEGAGPTWRTARHRQRQGDRRPTPWTRLRCRVVEVRWHRLRVWRVLPRWRRPVARVLYLHGGGYVHPLTVDYWRLVRSLTGSAVEVVVPAYPLAPGTHVDDVVPRLVELAEGAAGDLPLVLMGDSAGGALSLVLARALADRGVDVRRVVLLSPWLDATLAEPGTQDLEPTYPMLAESGLRAAGRWWAGPRDPADPLVSPVHLDLAGLAPLVVLVGDRDILRPGVDALADRARATPGADLRVVERTSMFHVWMTRLLPEGAQARRLLRRLVAA